MRNYNTPTYSKRHYEDAVALIHKMADECDLAPCQLRWMITTYVRRFSEDNPAFDSDKFRAALVKRFNAEPVSSVQDTCVCKLDGDAVAAAFA